MNLLIIFAAKYLIALPVLVLLACFLFARGKTLRQLAWLTALSLPTAYLAGRLAGLLFNNPRPFVVGNFTPLIAHAADNGFPSDHTLLAATLAMIVLYANRPAGICLWIVAIGIGVSRVLAGVHHGVDVIASMIIAIAAVLLSQFVIARLRRL